MLPASHASRPARGHWALVSLLLLALLLLGFYQEPVVDFLTACWQRVLGALGLQRQAAAFQQGINGQVAKRLLPAVATYAAIYLAISLLLLRLLLPEQWRLVWRLYAGGLVVYAALVVLGKLGGDVRWAYRLSRQLLDFMVSPLPVAGLFVLLRAGLVTPRRA
ncbi:XrtX-associated membrane protein [Hymenobacter properus]|uniref:Uncharacterized protein n=1 Tax=Hymenobacter properus TaxID=2791026 RepID=A0A931BES8_9BACT|nr:hypothetical protein [Hymenobacter properus]MBF9142509.1 hypothetical protein [Hymenobacter properus]MBR7721316.1 hypothetical protein [Microvirga sp. SRT04]